MLGAAEGQEERLSRFLDIPHDYISAGTARRSVDAVITQRYGKDEAAHYLPRLLQLPGAGADAIDFHELPPTCVVCKVFEHEIPIAEYVMAAILQKHRDAAGIFRRAVRRCFLQRRWVRHNGILCRRA